MSLFVMWTAVLVSFLLDWKIGGYFAFVFAITYIFLSVMTSFTRATFRSVERFKNHIIDVIMDRLRLIRPMPKSKDLENTISVFLSMIVAGVHISSVVEIFSGPINVLFEWCIGIFFIFCISIFLALPSTEKWSLKVGKKIRDKDEIQKRKKDIPLRKV